MSIQQTISVHGELVHTLTSDGSSLSDFDLNRVENDSETSFDYTKRHDGGELPDLKVENEFAALVQSLQEAKNESNRVLTQMMKRELSEVQSEGKDEDSESALKKPREDEEKDMEEEECP